MAIQLLVLTLRRGGPLFVRPDCIAAIQETGGFVVVTLTSGHEFEVLEGADDPAWNKVIRWRCE